LQLLDMSAAADVVLRQAEALGGEPGPAQSDLVQHRRLRARPPRAA
jgi:hypothetical protein